jgi:hypothetical protein
MKTSVLKAVLMFVLALSMTTYAATIAHWNFEDGVDGQPFTPEGQPAGSGGSADLVAGYLARGWNSYYGPGFSSDTISGSLGMRNADHHQDGYCDHPDMQEWFSPTWTIECTVKLVDGVHNNWWQTFIGKDGSAEQSDPESVFYLQKTFDNYFRINFRTDFGERYIATSEYQMEENKWYGIVATSDGSMLRLFVNNYTDGTGWFEAANLQMGENDNSLALCICNWTFGRGWYNGDFVDHIDGYMDDIRFSDEALTPDQFITQIPEPATMLLLGLGALVSVRKRK